MALRQFVWVIDLVREVKVLTVVFYDNMIHLKGYPVFSEAIWMACDVDYEKKRTFSNTFHELAGQNCRIFVKVQICFLLFGPRNWLENVEIPQQEVNSTP